MESSDIMGIYESLLTDYVDIKVRSADATNDYGEISYNWTTTEDIKCKIFQVSYEEKKNKEGEWIDAKYNIYFKNTQNLSVEDRIVYNADEYEIIEIFEDCESQFKRALVKEI